jgi:hypothetical protein
MKTAILVDGGFYRRRAYSLWRDKSPEDRADELVTYCNRHLHDHYIDQRMEREKSPSG